MKRRNWLKKSPVPALLFWLGVWFLAAQAMNQPLLLPSPIRVFACLGQMMQTAAFWQTTAVSIGRVLFGVVGAVVLGCLLAAAASRSALVERLIAPAMTALQATPVASISILVLIWIDRNYVPVLICGMMVLPVVFSGVCTGIRETDRQLLEMAKVFRLSGFQILRRIYVPSVMPFFRTACLSGIGLGWKAGIAAEVLTVPKHSMGRMIWDSKLYLLTEELFAWTLAVIFLSLLLQKLLLKLLQRGKNHA